MIEGQIPLFTPFVESSKATRGAGSADSGQGTKREGDVETSVSPGPDRGEIPRLHFSIRIEWSCNLSGRID